MRGLQQPKFALLPTLRGRCAFAPLRFVHPRITRNPDVNLNKFEVLKNEEGSFPFKTIIYPTPLNVFMVKLIAIGGGENGRPGTKYETRQIDEEIVRFSGKNHPKVLFIPPPSQFQEDYFKVMQKVFVRLGCDISPLYLSNPNPNKRELEETVLGADIIYVGGGNTLKMLKYWRKHGIDKILQKAAKKDIVLSGLSAGAICWFKYAQSDSWKMTNPENPYIRVHGLDLIQALCAPHFTREKDRYSDLRDIMKRSTGVGIALEDCCAVEIINREYRLITSKPDAQAYKVYWKNNKYHQETIEKKKTFSPLDELLRK